MWSTLFTRNALLCGPRFLLKPFVTALDGVSSLFSEPGDSITHDWDQAMKEREQTIRFSVSLPDALLSELDRRVIARGYASRSEFVRDLIREKIVEDRWAADDEEVVGVLTISYDHHQKELVQKILDAQHSRYVHILCATHVHLDHNNCLEAIIIRGRPSDIQKISIEIGGLKGVGFAGLTRGSAGKP